MRWRDYVRPVEETRGASGDMLGRAGSPADSKTPQGRARSSGAACTEASAF